MRYSRRITNRAEPNLSLNLLSPVRWMDVDWLHQQKVRKERKRTIFIGETVSVEGINIVYEGWEVLHAYDNRLLTVISVWGRSVISTKDRATFGRCFPKGRWLVGWLIEKILVVWTKNHRQIFSKDHRRAVLYLLFPKGCEFIDVTCRF